MTHEKMPDALTDEDCAEVARMLAYTSAILGRIPYKMMGMDKEPSEESKRAVHAALQSTKEQP